MAVAIKLKDDNATVIAQSTGNEAALLLEGSWYFSAEQVDFTYLKKTDHIYKCPYKGIAHWYNLEAPNMSAKNIAWVYENPQDGYEHIAGRIGFYERETSVTVSEKVDEAMA